MEKYQFTEKNSGENTTITPLETVIKNVKNIILSYKTEMIMFIIAFLYISYFTLGVGFFWEDTFTIGYPEKWSYILIEMFRFGTSNFYDAGAPVHLLYSVITYDLVGANYNGFRILRALIFAFTIALLFRCTLNTSLRLNSLKPYAKEIAFMVAVLVLTSYAYFIAILQIPRAQYLSIPFKILGFYFFFKWYQKYNLDLNWLQVTGLFILFFLAIKGHPASVSVILVLAGFILLVKPRKLFDAKIIILLVLIAAVNFPLQLFHFELPSHDAYSYQPDVIARYFEISPILHFPFINVQNLYYKSLFEVITLPGVLLGIISLAGLLILRIAKKEICFKDDAVRAFLILNILWFFSELLTLFKTPDPATRYLCMLLLPVSLILIVLYVSFLAKIPTSNIKKRLYSLFIVLVLLVCIINVFYTYLFRATWGSSFIAAAKTSEYFSSVNRSSSTALYYSDSVAGEYYIMTDPFVYDKSMQETFLFFQKVSYEKFQQQYLEKLKEEYEHVFIIKRISSTGQSAYPNISFPESDGFKEIKTIEGRSNSFFDRFTWVLTRIFSLPVHPNKVVIYEYEPLNK